VDLDFRFHNFQGTRFGTGRCLHQPSHQFHSAKKKGRSPSSRLLSVCALRKAQPWKSLLKWAQTSFARLTRIFSAQGKSHIANLHLQARNVIFSHDQPVEFGRGIEA
jgi:hypothetical protein